jgi:predicted enzyme involved in methoxymalonyl-ACP biosynthesis
LGELALRSGRNKLEIVYLPTSKNRQVGDFLETVTSKVPSENGKNIFDPKALIALKPSWITI